MYWPGAGQLSAGTGDVTGQEPGGPDVAGRADQARAYLAGDLAVRLDAGQQRDLVMALAGSPGWDDQWLALELLRTASDEDLTVLFDSAGGLLAVLEDGIPPGHKQRLELDYVLAVRFEGGRDGLLAGRVVPHGQPAGLFSPALLDGSLAGLPLDRELGGEELSRVEAAVRQADIAALPEMLLGLPPVEQARAARWLAGVRIALDAQGGSPQATWTLKYALDMLYRVAADGVLDAAALRLVTIRPPAGKAGELRRALDPARREASGLPPPFTRRLSGQDQDFADRLAEAYRSDIKNLTQLHVEGRRAADRVPDRLFPMARMEQVAAAASRWLEGAFGHLVEIPRLNADRDGIRDPRPVAGRR